MALHGGEAPRGIDPLMFEFNGKGSSKIAGAKLRDRRLSLRLTLSELSLRTGFPVSTLSKVETDKMSLTYDKLIRISEGLGIDPAEIFEDKQVDVPQAQIFGRRSITRLNDGGVIETPSYRHIYHGIDLLGKSFIPLVAEIKHRRIEDFSDFIRHEGEEYTYVLEGSLEFHCELYAPVILRTGESVYFDSSMGHAYVAIGDETCRVLSICAGPGAGSLKPDAPKPPSLSRATPLAVAPADPVLEQDRTVEVVKKRPERASSKTPAAKKPKASGNKK